MKNPNYSEIVCNHEKNYFIKNYSEIANIYMLFGLNKCMSNFFK